VSRPVNVMCKRPHYHVRKGNGKMLWQRYYSHDWAMQSARAWGGVIVGTYSRADYCEGCLEIKRERQKRGVNAS
jgi:hypothetical protein